MMQYCRGEYYKAKSGTHRYSEWIDEFDLQQSFAQSSASDPDHYEEITIPVNSYVALSTLSGEGYVYETPNLVAKFPVDTSCARSLGGRNSVHLMLEIYGHLMAGNHILHPS